ncbi:hypothetical protein B0H67DRAFT_543167 [Lasiosphaeris hirsuta]|uniref:NACHT domain-containing protein n=1 Tax=Lasiosphaeris hirsuta TaxID=260670 RepID=A0AA40A294_9PEZI|nr:hypothetical protein B0H67DRAFT_543167 [Lasiosphaeris hirsuta]
MVREDILLKPVVKNYEDYFYTVLWPRGFEARGDDAMTGADGLAMPDDTQRAQETPGEWHFQEVANSYAEAVERHAASRGIASAAVQFIQNTRDVVGAALSVSPPAALAWAGICMVILPIIVNHSEQIAAKQVGFSYVMSRFAWYSHVIDLLNRDYWKSQHSFTALQRGIRAEIVVLYKLLIEYQLRAYYAYCRPLTTISRDIVKLDDWTGMISAIKSTEKGLQDYMDLNFDHHLLEKLHTISKEAHRKQRGDILRKFKFPDEIPYQVYQAYLDSIESPHDGTGLGVFAHPQFINWATAYTGALVLTGIPGSGKSVFAKAMLTKLPQLRPTAVCSFFFKDGRGQNTAAAAICRVLDELFSARIELVDTIDSKVEHLLPQEVRYNLDLLWTVLMDATRDLEPGAVTVVLDAVDECEPESAAKLYNKLSAYLRVSTPTPRVKFFITTRPFTSPHQPQHAVTIKMNEDQHCLRYLSKDIERVVAWRFEHFARICIHDEVLKQELVDLIRPRAERTYLFVKLLFDCLELRIRDGLPRMPRDWISSFKTLPTTVKEAYLKFLGRVRETHRHDVKVMLQIVAASARPLTVRELNIALNIKDCRTGSADGLGLQAEEFFRDWIVDAGRYFLDVYDGRVYFIHQTAKDYLLADSSDKTCVKPDWLGDFSVASCNGALADSCITYLNLPFAAKSRFRESNLIVDDAESITKTSDHHLWSLDELAFSNYATMHWQKHVWDGQIPVQSLWEPGAAPTDESISPLKALESRFVVSDHNWSPLPRIPKISIEAINTTERLARSLRSLATFRTIKALTNYRHYSPLPMDWFSIRIFNKDITHGDVSFNRLQVYHGDMVSYVISNRLETAPVHMHMLSLNASWSIGTLLWNVRIPPLGERTGELTMTIPRKVNDDDPNEIEDMIIIIFSVDWLCGERFRSAAEWLKSIYTPPILITPERQHQSVSTWLPFVPPPNWQVRYFTVQTVQRGRSDSESGY